MLRIQLISPSLGSVVIRDADPIGLNDLEQTLKRSDKNDGAIREIVIKLQFIKSSIQFIERVFNQTGGPDAVMIVNIYEYLPNPRTWELYGSGRANFNTWDREEATLGFLIEQVGFQRDIENGLNVDVDIETLLSQTGISLPAQQVEQLGLHSKRILYTTQGNWVDEEVIIRELDDQQYMSLDVNVLQKSELQTKEDVGTEITDEPPEAIFVFEYGGELHIDFKVFFRNLDDLTNVRLGYYFNGEPATFFNGVLIHSDETWRYQFTLDRTIVKGDRIRLFMFNNLGSLKEMYFDNFNEANPLQLLITNLSETAASTSKSIFLHDAIKRNVQYLTGQIDCFKSDLLGRVELGYEEDGKGGDILTTNGSRIRKRNKKQFWNLQNLSNLANSLYCTGIGYETDELNVQRMVLEQKAYFYNKNSLIMDLGSVYKVRRKINYDRLFNQFVFGYSTKIDISTTNAVDAFNTLRKYVINLINSQNSIQVSNPTIADGYQIEYQRRLIEVSEDGKLDDNNFIIKAVRDGLGGWKAAKDEGYSSITGVIDPGSGYNYGISPAYIIQEWKQYLAASLIYAQTAKAATFSSGEGNYEMVTTKVGQEPLAEDGTVSLAGIEPLWTPFDLTFDNHPLYSHQFKIMRNNPYGYYSFSDLNKTIYNGFMSEITHNQNERIGDFKLIEVYRP